MLRNIKLTLIRLTCKLFSPAIDLNSRLYMTPRKQNAIITVTPDGRASIDANMLFREESELEALRRLSSAVQKQIQRRAIAKRAHAAGPA
jgi:ArsR family metal-binding transcriptional regulator